MKKLFDWYLQGPTKDMSKSKIIYGLIISVVICLIALTGLIGKLLKITGFFEPSYNIIQCDLEDKYWCYPDCSNAIKYWKFQSDLTFMSSGGAWGTWKKDIVSNQIEVVNQAAGSQWLKKTLSMPDCDSLKDGYNVFLAIDIIYNENGEY